MKKILKDNRGSITTVVTVTVLFFSVILSTAYMITSTNRKTQLKSELTARETYEKPLNNLDEIREEVTGLPTTDETQPYFPSNDFKRVKGTNLSNGFVIEDSDGNQYVWVEVPKSLYNNVNYNSNNAKKPSSSTDYANIEYCLQQYTAAYKKETGYSDTYKADDKNVGWFADETAYNNLKNSMLKSVYENGGFYVGRYEAGIGTNRTSIESQVDRKYPVPTTAPVSKADAYPYTYVTRTQAQNLASNVNSGTKTSSLMFGVQWDLVLAFMHNKGNIADSTLISNSTTIGNYRDSTFQLSQTGKYAVYSSYSLSSTWNPSTKSTTNFVDSSRNKIAQSLEGNGILVTTGTSETNKVMNIYDIAGNVWEWTLEWTSDTSYPCAFRGGDCYSTGSSRPAAFRNDDSTDSSSYKHRFPCFTFLGKAER